MDTIGLVIFSSLFVLSGINHIRNSSAMVGYTATSLGDCPVAKPLSYLGGWPTGLFLTVFGVGAAFNESAVFAYGLAGFLAVVTALFHRNLRDPANLKNVALLGSALYIASQAH